MRNILNVLFFSLKRRLVFLYNIFFICYAKLKNLFFPSIVDFYLIDSMEISHFLPLYLRLNQCNIKSVFIVEPTSYNVSKDWFDYDKAIKTLKSLHLDYRFIYNKNAQFAITTQFSDILQKYKKAKKISYAYGLGFTRDYFNLSPRTTIGFDYRFVHGQFMQEVQSKYFDVNKIKIMGYPRYYNEKIQSRDKLKQDLGIKTPKPIVVYFPTWDKDCCAKLFGQAIRLLKENYFIVTKFHHCLERLPELEEERQSIRNFSDLILPSDYPLSWSASLAEYAIIDAKSGASTEVPYINTHVHLVLLTLRKNIKNDFYYDEISNLGIIINNPSDLHKAVDSCKIDCEKRKLFLDYLFGDKETDFLDNIVHIFRR